MGPRGGAVQESGRSWTRSKVESGEEESMAGKAAGSRTGNRLEVVFFWFRSGRGCGPALPRGAPPPCGRASCASCAPSCPCGGGACNGGLSALHRRQKVY